MVLKVWAGGLLTFDRLHRQRERSGLPLEIRRLDQAAQMYRLFAGLSVMIGFAIPWSVMRLFPATVQAQQWQTSPT
jgi:hypothetical protein